MKLYVYSIFGRLQSFVNEISFGKRRNFWISTSLFEIGGKCILFCRINNNRRIRFIWNLDIKFALFFYFHSLFQSLRSPNLLPIKQTYWKKYFVYVSLNSQWFVTLFGSFFQFFLLSFLFRCFLRFLFVFAIESTDKRTSWIWVFKFMCAGRVRFRVEYYYASQHNIYQKQHENHYFYLL